MLYAILVVYGSTIALLVGFHREMSWAAKTVDGYLRTGRYQPTADRALVRQALHYREAHGDDLEGVAALLERAVEVDPNSEAILYLAATYQQMGDDHRALAMYERYRSIDPLAIPAYMGTVQILEKRGELEAAAQLLTQGIRLYRVHVARYEPKLDPSAGAVFNAKARAVHQHALEGLKLLEGTRRRIWKSM